MAKNKKALVKGNEKPSYTPPVKLVTAPTPQVNIPSNPPQSVLEKSNYDTSNFKKYQPAQGMVNKVNPAPGTVETFTNAKTGRASGVVGPDGKVYLGLSPEDVDLFAQQQADITERPANSQPVGTAQNQAEQQQQINEAMQMAQQGLLSPEELQSVQGAPLDMGQALGAGAVGVLPGAVAGALTGAVGGLIAGSPTGPGALVTGVLGAVGGFLIGMRSSIKSQQVGEFSADKAALTKGERYLRSLITDTNKNPQNSAENIALFYQTLNLIDSAHAKTWKDSQEDLNRFLGNDGTPELARFEVFDETMRNYYISQFNTALDQPNPNNILITSEDLGLENEE